MSPRGDARRLHGSLARDGAQRGWAGPYQSREEERERLYSRKSSWGTRSLPQGSSREERGRTRTLCLRPSWGKGSSRSVPSAVPASPARPCRTPGPAGWSAPAAALPAAGRSGDKDTAPLVLPRPSPLRLLGERSGPPQRPWPTFLPMTPVPQSADGLGAPNSSMARSRCRRHQNSPTRGFWFLPRLVTAVLESGPETRAAVFHWRV